MFYPHSQNFNMCFSGGSKHIQTVINFLPCELQHVVNYCAHGCSDSFAKGLDVWNRCSVDFVFYIRISYIILLCCFLMVEPYDSRLYFLRTKVTDFVSANLITHCLFSIRDHCSNRLAIVPMLWIRQQSTVFGIALLFDCFIVFESGVSS